MKLSIEDNNLISVNTYDHCAEAYERKYMDTSAYKTGVDEFCYNLPSERAKILDVGCGPGNFSKYLYDNGYKNVHGIDLSLEMIRRARKNVPSAVFQVVDVRKMHVVSNSYHGIFVSFCIPYLSYNDTEKLLSDLFRMLKPSGIIYLSCLEGIKTAGFEQTSFSGEMPVYIYYYTEEFLAGAMEEKNFQILSVNRQPYHDRDGIISTDLIIIAQKI